MDWSLGSFGDLRLDNGGGTLLEQMVARKTVCRSLSSGRPRAGPVGRLGGTRKGEERAGRFFANPKVTAGKIIQGWSTLTGAACAGRHVLAIDSLPLRRRGIPVR